MRACVRRRSLDVGGEGAAIPADPGLRRGGKPGKTAGTEQWYNGAFVVDPVVGLQTTYYAKRHLVPFGEYVTLRPVLGLDRQSSCRSAMTCRDAGSISSPLVVPLLAGRSTFGPLICYEDIYPGLARASALAGSDVLVVLNNNAWFGEGGAAYQHAANSVLRAVQEARRPVLRDGNGGWSKAAWIDEFGSIRSTLVNDAGTIYFRGTKTLTITRDARWIGRYSFYTEHGDWFVAVCAVLAVFGFALLKVGRPSES